jgi:S-adenosylmethionine-diacylglycerol 3-amino-3-carboxypropyl transferase
MQSEFTQVPLDCLRYGLVWEGHRTLYDALDLQADDHALVVTSAGCNVLNTLLAGPRQVTAIDLNPVQNELLRLKVHVLRHHPHQVLRGLLGLDGPAGVSAATTAILRTLLAASRRPWADLLGQHPRGLMLAGRLEGYVTGFLPSLPLALQEKMRQLVTCETVARQQAFFQTELETTDFPTRFIDYFDQANLSRGRDPHLFRYAAASGGHVFYQRLRWQLGRQLARDNFFFRFLFFGPEGLPEHVLPPCYQAAHHEQLRTLLPRLRVHTGEASAFLLSAAGQDVRKASLSNIFEYVSPAELGRVVRALGQRAQPLRAVFWNLLQAQAPRRTASLPLLETTSAELSARDACFYFGGVRVLDFAGNPAAELHPVPLTAPLPHFLTFNSSSL